jgi:hypothetical protein
VSPLTVPEMLWDTGTAVAAKSFAVELAAAIVTALLVGAKVKPEREGVTV